VAEAGSEALPANTFRYRPAVTARDQPRRWVATPEHRPSRATANTLRAMAEEAGRDPDSLDITVMCLETVEAQELRDYADAGATRLVVRPPVDSLNQYRDFIDRYAELLQPAI
jgi:alkanesulfonate monooxygenase SsuD/methylene tetrahydromethanopterin reductase-like flavin-dependent oxidoreductase (luciferase family)